MGSTVAGAASDASGWTPGTRASGSSPVTVSADGATEVADFRLSGERRGRFGAGSLRPGDRLKRFERRRRVRRFERVRRRLRLHGKDSHGFGRRVGGRRRRAEPSPVRSCRRAARTTGSAKAGSAPRSAHLPRAAATAAVAAADPAQRAPPEAARCRPAAPARQFLPRSRRQGTPCRPASTRAGARGPPTRQFVLPSRRPARRYLPAAKKADARRLPARRPPGCRRRPWPSRPCSRRPASGETAGWTVSGDRFAMTSGCSACGARSICRHRLQRFGSGTRDGLRACRGKSLPIGQRRGFALCSAFSARRHRRGDRRGLVREGDLGRRGVCARDPRTSRIAPATPLACSAMEAAMPIAQ